MSWRHLTPRHQSVVAMVGHALTLKDDVDIWCGLALILRTRLSPVERGCLAVAALDAADDEQFWLALEACMSPRLAGHPLPPFLDIDADARWWADLASPAELRAWLAACFVRLPSREKTSFLSAAKRRAIA